MPPPKSKSKYADNFQIRGNKATCNKCGKILSMNDGNTSGLAYHCKNVCHVQIGHASKDKNMKPQQDQQQQQSTLDGFVKIKKPMKEEIISREAALGATFRFVTKSPSIKANMNRHGFNVPRSENTVRKYVRFSANKHRRILREEIQKQLKKGQRFCAITDEWTCPVKKRKFLNVQIHLKGNYCIICHAFVWQVIQNSTPYFVLNTLQM